MAKDKRKRSPETRVLTPEFRASYAHVFEPYAYDQTQEPKFCITMLFEKDTDIATLKKAVVAACNDEWKSKDKWPKGLIIPFKDGDTESDKPESAGHIIVRASTKQRPGVVDQKRTPITKEDGSFYSGCYARATLQASAWSYAGRSGVTFYLQNVQKLRDGDRFGGGRSAEDDFDEVSDTSEDSSSYDKEAQEAFSLD